VGTRIYSCAHVCSLYSVLSLNEGVLLHQPASMRYHCIQHVEGKAIK
jgi:hypothetical protein